MSDWEGNIGDGRDKVLCWAWYLQKGKNCLWKLRAISLQWSWGGRVQDPKGASRAKWKTTALDFRRADLNLNLSALHSRWRPAQLADKKRKISYSKINLAEKNLVYQLHQILILIRWSRAKQSYLNGEWTCKLVQERLKIIKYFKIMLSWVKSGPWQQKRPSMSWGPSSTA